MTEETPSLLTPGGESDGGNLPAVVSLLVLRAISPFRKIGGLVTEDLARRDIFSMCKRSFRRRALRLRQGTTLLLNKCSLRRLPLFAVPLLLGFVCLMCRPRNSVGRLSVGDVIETPDGILFQVTRLIWGPSPNYRVFEAENMKTHARAAVKQGLWLSDEWTNEWSALTEMRGVEGFPNPIHYNDSAKYAIMQLLGESLDEIHSKNYAGKPLPPRTIGSIGLQALGLFEALHRNGIVQNDKAKTPDAWVVRSRIGVGVGEDNTRLYLMHFSHMRRFNISSESPGAQLEDLKALADVLASLSSDLTTKAAARLSQIIPIAPTRAYNSTNGVFGGKRARLGDKREEVTPHQEGHTRGPQGCFGRGQFTKPLDKGCRRDVHREQERLDNGYLLDFYRELERLETEGSREAIDYFRLSECLHGMVEAGGSKYAGHVLY